MDGSGELLRTRFRVSLGHVWSVNAMLSALSLNVAQAFPNEI